jgi:hypothetical protein|tara:strand:- start:167 stop:1006 length:840 start_codon:yes stop_codon:yes gene_type:complete
LKIDISESFINKSRVNLIKKICGNKAGEELEKAVSNAFENIADSLDEKTYKLIDFITKLDNINTHTDENLPNYTLKNKNVHVIKDEKSLNEAVSSLNNSKILGFDTEQKPIFQKGVPPSPIAIIQMSNASDCYLFQVHLIKNIKPLLDILTNRNIVKVGIGLDGDNSALYKEFRIRPKCCIDFGSLFKSKMAYPNDIGAKKSVLLFLNKNLQKSKKISRSNWENINLTDTQVKYASEDASCVYDVFCNMLTTYPFLIQILPSWFEERYNKNEYRELIKI